MKTHAFLAKTTTDDLQSKMMSDRICRIVLDCYMTPEEFASLVGKYFNSITGFNVFFVDKNENKHE